MFAIGLFCAYKPIKAKAAETIGFSFEKISPGASEYEDPTLSFSVRLGSTALNNLKQGRTASSRSYTDYLLEITYSTSAAGSGEAVYYHIEQSDYLPDTPGASFPSSNDPLYSPYSYDYTFGSGFLSSGQGVLSIAIPSDLQTEYYYRAKVIKATYVVEFDRDYAGSSGFANEQAETVAESSGYYKNSIWKIGMTQLEGSEPLTDAERSGIQTILGIKPSAAEISVTLKYKELTDYATLTEKSYTFQLKSAYAQNKTLAVTTLYSLTDFSNIADFNAVYTGDFWRDGYKYTTQERIILQARDFEYSYNPTTEKGTLEVKYNDFQYKDLSLRVTNNDPANNLTIDYYTSEAVAGATSTTLTFRFADIEEQLHNSCNWLFDFGKDNIRISGKPEGVTTQLTEEALIVTFPNAKESELVNLSLIGVAEIIEDVEYTLTYEYAELTLNGTKISETWKTSAPIVKMYSEIVTCNYTNFMLDYGDAVRAAVNPEFLDGAEYYIPISIKKEYSAYDSETHTCKITVEYSYNTLFGITNNYDESIIFKALDHSSLNYGGEYFVDSIPDGYRVERLTTEAAYKEKLTITNAEDYRNATIEVRTSTTAKEVLPVEVVFTDSWKMVVTYLENYIDYGMKQGEKDKDGKPVKACFAEKKVFSGSVKVKDVADIYHPTNAEMSKILGLENLDILGLATAERISVTFDGVSTYTAKLSYSYAALKQIDYNGNAKEIKIPLTSYADWCEEYGKEWSILFLNRTDRHFFKYSNDVTRENLYGFFSVAVFKEQVSDLNFYFKNNTGDGCMTIFSQSEVRGSGVYKFFSSLATKSGFMGILLGTPLISTMCMNLCELVDDDNAMYYSYFFYLDGTSENPYLSNGGADNADDTDSAIKNALNDAKEWFKNTWDKLNGSNAMKWLKILGGVALGILALTALIAGVYKILKWSGIIKPKRKTAAVKNPKPKRKKKTRTKAKK
jgi:hypothetical protein